MWQFIGSLPRAGPEAYHPPLTFTGVDLFGPLTVKWGRGTAKRWSCLFTCLAIRAVYLEVTPSLFDRGSNFVGANRELKEAIAHRNEETIE